MSPRPALERARRRVVDGRVEGERRPDVVVDLAVVRAPRGEGADAAEEELAREAVVLQDPIAHPLEDVMLEQNLEIYFPSFFDSFCVIFKRIPC